SVVSANLLWPHRGRGTSCSPGHRSLHEFFASCDLTTAYRRPTSRAEIIEDFAIRQHQEKPLPHWHRGFTFVAIKTGSSEAFKLLLVHTRRSRSSRYRAELWRAAAWRQPPRPALWGNAKALASIRFRRYQDAVGSPVRLRRRGDFLSERVSL